MALLTRQPSLGSLKGINPDLSSTLTESDPLLSPTDAQLFGFRRIRRCCRCSRKRLRNIVTLLTIWVAYLLVSSAYSIIAPFYPQEAAGFGVGSLYVGVIVGASPLAVVLLSPIIGYFIPQLGLKFLILSGAFLVGGAYTLLAFITMMSNKWQFIIFSCLLRLLEGVGSAAYLIGSFTIATIMYPSSTGAIIGLLELGSAVGYILGPPLGGVLYNIGGYKLPFLVVGGTLMAFLPLLYLLLPNTPGKKQYIPLQTLVKLLCDVPFLLLVSCSIVVIAGFGFYTPVLAPFLMQKFQLSEIGLSLVFLVCPITYMICSYIAGHLADKMNPRHLINGGFVVMGLSFFFVGPSYFISLQSYLWLTCVAFAVLGVGAAFALIPIFTDMLQIARKIDLQTDPEAMNGIISGVSSSALSLGEFLGPIIGGLLTQALSFERGATVFGEIVLAQGFLLLGVTLIDYFCRN